MHFKRKLFKIYVYTYYLSNGSGRSMGHVVQASESLKPIVMRKSNFLATAPFDWNPLIKTLTKIGCKFCPILKIVKSLNCENALCWHFDATLVLTWLLLCQGVTEDIHSPHYWVVAWKIVIRECNNAIKSFCYSLMMYV